MIPGEDFITAIKRQVTGTQPLLIAVGQVRIIPAELLSARVAVVSGIADSPTGDAIRVPESSRSWCRAFRQAVDAGVVDGQMVLLAFNAGQPVIVDVMGV